MNFTDDETPPATPACRAPCTTAWTGTYRSGDGEYKIRRDQDGYEIMKPDGGVDAMGSGYEWYDVKESYGLVGVAASSCDCK